MNKLSVSVVITAYNGKKYIAEELESILPQLSVEDEVLILDDGSRDGTQDIVRQYAQKWPQIQLIEEGHAGVIHNFERGIQRAKGDVIFLADQDDTWKSDKVEKVCQAFQNCHGPKAVIHDASFVNGKNEPLGETLFHWRSVQTGFYKNWMRNSYMGCCMAFNQELKAKVLPFPKRIPMHDQWIGLLAEHYGTVELLKDPLIRYRRHDQTVTDDQHKGVGQMIKWRFQLLHQYIKRIIFGG